MTYNTGQHQEQAPQQEDEQQQQKQRQPNRKDSNTKMTEFDDTDNDTVIPDDFREVHELSAVDVKTSNWKGTLISIVVILLLSSLIILAIYIINPDIQYKFHQEQKQKLNLTELLDGHYSVQSTFTGSWISDWEIVYITSNRDFVKYDVRTDNITIIVPATRMKQHEVDRAILSPNRQFVLFTSRIKNVFRHSTLALYKIYDLQDETITPVKPDNTAGDVSLQACKWGPTKAQLVFVYQNNLYYWPDPLTEKPVAITQDFYDKTNNILNGIPDWLYEEEILASGTAFWWSPDGSRLSFIRFNDSNVDVQEYPWYGDVVDLDTQYSDRVKVKYPKAGRINPTVQLFVVLLDRNDYRPLEVLPPEDIAQSDHYITSMTWANDHSLIAVWMTREQNHASYSICSPNNSDSWLCKDHFVETTENGWLEINPVSVDRKGENYFILNADRTVQQHVQIVKVNIKTNQSTYLTNAKSDVTQILKVVPGNEDANNPGNDDGGNTIYYMATREGKPGERHCFSLTDQTVRRWPKNSDNPNSILNKMAPTTTKNNPKCLTCDQTELNQCLYNRVTFSQNGQNFIQECLGPDIPYSILRKMNENGTFTALQQNCTQQLTETTDGTKIWESNEKLKKTLENKLLPQIRTELIKRPTDTGSVQIIVQMFMPPLFNENRVVKYPMLVQVYGGPGSQNVNENFKMNFGKYLASNKEIIYAYIDGRGSGLQGETMKHQLFHRLGTVEIEDQIFAARYLRDKYNFVNRDAIGIWGWSYGGYATAMVLANDIQDPVFACGISVAPVTSWLLYDSAYTERFMGLPNNETLQNYITSSVMNMFQPNDTAKNDSVNSFKNKKYLLIHGTADDNVHIQNSMILIKELNKANILFQTQIYPDENHGLHGVGVHLYTTMEQFWNDCFQTDYYFEEIGLRRRRVSKT